MVTKQILIVDDDPSNRAVLAEILSTKYTLLYAENGLQAFNLLNQPQVSVDAVLLDLVMPVMSGYEFLSNVRAMPQFVSLPIIVITQFKGVEVELKTLALGANDFLTKPFNALILQQRLANLLLFNEVAVLDNAKERDILTGVYNKKAFSRRLGVLLNENPDVAYCLVSINIERFKIVNDLFGVITGDKVLCFLAQTLAAGIDSRVGCYGRIVSDRFAFCLPETAPIEKIIGQITAKFDAYPLDLTLHICFGIYKIDDLTLSVEAMCDRANLAIDSMKGNYNLNFVYYTEEHRNQLLAEQDIINNMYSALAEGQFAMYIQPKFALTDKTLIGGEALVRWLSPQQGIISPDDFIPVFERNGFITKLDDFMLTTACATLRHWLDLGYQPVPLSVNVSRVDIYNPNFIDNLMAIVTKYQIAPALLELEITETAYKENPEQLILVTKQLKSLGFLVEMDDFGSGYSSLNMLNEVPVDVIKMDMRFLKTYQDNSRSANILNFIINMTKWLNIPVIAEGVETEEQVTFLRSMGCNWGQGFYFSKPLTISDFETMMLSGTSEKSLVMGELFSALPDINELWRADSAFNLIFNNYVGALAIYELKGDFLSLIRGNDRYYEICGHDLNFLYTSAVSLMNTVYPDDRQRYWQALLKAKATNGEFVLDTRWMNADGQILWLHVFKKVLYNSTERTVFLGSVEDFTQRVALQEQLVQQEKDSNRQIKQQRDFFEQLYNSVPCGILQSSLDEKLTVLNINNAALNFLGYTSEAEKAAFWQVAHGSMDFVVTESQQDVQKMVGKTNQAVAGQVTELEYQIKNNAGQRMWVHEDCQVVVNQQGQRVLQSVLSNINARKAHEFEIEQHEKEIRYHNEYLLNLYNSLVCGIVRFTCEHNYEILYYNKMAAAMLGYGDDSNFNPHYLYDFAYAAEQDWQVVQAAFAKLQKQGDQATYEVKMKKPQGTFVWVLCTCYRSLDLDKQEVIQCSFVDITENKDNEEQLRVSEARFRLAFAMTEMNMWQYDIKKQKITHSEYMMNTFGVGKYLEYVPEGFKNNPNVAPQSVEKLVEIHQQVDNGVSPVSANVLLRKKNELNFAWENVIYSTIFDENGKPSVAIGISRDINKEVEAEAKYVRELQFRKNITGAALSFWECDLTEEKVLACDKDQLTNGLIQVGDSLTALCHVLRQRFICSHNSCSLTELGCKQSLLDLLHAGKREVYLEYRYQVQVTPPQMADEDQVPTAECRWAGITLTMVDNPLNQHVLLFVHIADINMKKIQDLKIQEQAEKDALTGLYNRATVELLVDDYLRQDKQRPVALLMLDLDDFKNINDTFGHLYGDKVLQITAEILSQMFRQGDLVARLGGDEMVVFLKNITSAQMAIKKAEQICAAFGQWYDLDKNCVLSCSIGVAVTLAEDDNFQRLYHQADVALYQAKQLGKNQVCLYRATKKLP